MIGELDEDGERIVHLAALESGRGCSAPGVGGMSEVFCSDVNCPGGGIDDGQQTTGVMFGQCLQVAMDQPGSIVRRLVTDLEGPLA